MIEKLAKAEKYSSSSSVYRGGVGRADGGVQFKIAKSKIAKLPPPFGVLPLAQLLSIHIFFCAEKQFQQEV